MNALTVGERAERLRSLFSPGTWDQLADKTLSWALRALPAVLVILLLAAMALRVARGVLNRLKPHMVKRMLEGRAADDKEVEKRIDTLFGILHGIMRVVVSAVAIMLILRNIGIDIAPILAGAGVVGLAVGFGAQELVRDVISGFFMLLENHIRTGDVVQVNGTGGLVEKVGLRTIVLRDAAGIVHVFQNGKVSTLSNMTKEWSAMVFDIGVAYDTDIPLAIDTMTQVAEQLQLDPEYGPRILEKMEVFGVETFGPSEIVIKARIKTKPGEQWPVAREYRKRLKVAFDDAKISFPFPQRTVWLRGETDKGPLPGAPPDAREDGG
jgi:small conductance mechanosensitive channel